MICIIGAGQSGLVTCKTFIESGLEVIVLEKSNNNGLFNLVKEKEFFNWSSSRYISGYSDYPISKKYPVWMNIKQFIEYLESYKKKFNLEKNIKYNCEVIKINKFNNEWNIFYKFNNEILKIKSSKLVICTGLNSVPKYPNLYNYKGEILHTDYIYRKMDKNDWEKKFKNKKILLLGGGESALDIGHLCLNYTSKLYYSTKNYIEWFPEGGILYDKKKLKKMKKYFGKSFNNMTNKYPTDTLLSYLEYSLPSPLSNIWHENGRKIIKKIFKKKVKCSHFHKKLCSLNKTPDNLFNKYVVKRSDFILDIYENKVKLIKYPIKFFNKTVYTEKENINNVDIIICGTGYEKKFNFLDKKYYSKGLIKNILSNNDKSLAFIGFARPTMGSLINLSEIQSWWVAEYFKSKLKYKIINHKQFRKNNPLNIKNDFVNTIVIGNYYYKDLARDLKITPNFIKLFFNNNKLWRHIIFSTIHPTMFRLRGIKKIDNAEEILYYTLPKFKERTKISKLYLLIFFILHILFFILIIIVSYFIIYKLLIITKYEYIYLIILIWLLLIYIYNNWY